MTRLHMERRSMTVWRIECQQTDGKTGQTIPIMAVEFEDRQAATEFFDSQRLSSNDSRWILSEFDVSWDELFVLSSNSWMDDPFEHFDPDFEHRHIASELLITTQEAS